jgi:glucokinase
MQVLAGDIGGTKTLLQIVEVQGRRCQVLREERYVSAAYDGLVAMLHDFLALARPSQGVAAACFGVAGPVATTPAGERARLTNLPWELDTADIQAALGLPAVGLINDFQATGYGIEALEAHELVDLQTGDAQARAPCVVLGAGTGLGQCLLVWCDDHYRSLPTEGGHVDFAPTDALQDALLQDLRVQHGRVSYERLLSGSGLVSIYRFLHRYDGPAAGVDLAATDTDPAPVITQAALDGSDRLAGAALDLFVRIYGAHAGDLALTALAMGGIYIAGGIAPKIVTRLQAPGFLQAFNDKGRMSPLTRAMPVRVILNPRVGVLGAALSAARLAVAAHGRR